MMLGIKLGIVRILEKRIIYFLDFMETNGILGNATNHINIMKNFRKNVSNMT